MTWHGFFFQGEIQLNTHFFSLLWSQDMELHSLVVLIKIRWQDQTYDRHQGSFTGLHFENTAWTRLGWCIFSLRYTVHWQCFDLETENTAMLCNCHVTANINTLVKDMWTLTCKERSLLVLALLMLATPSLFLLWNYLINPNVKLI